MEEKEALRVFEKMEGSEECEGWKECNSD